LSQRMNDSDAERSTSLVGNSSSFTLSTFPEKDLISLNNKYSVVESDNMPMPDDTNISNPVRHKRDLSIDKIPVSLNHIPKPKNSKKSERVVVHVRMRPFNRSELQKSKKSAIIKFDPEINLISIYKDRSEGLVSKFYFDSLMDENITQEEVYEGAGRRVVESFIEGYNGTIFAYGQTGTGKTFTMLGDYLSKSTSENAGIIPRSLGQVFSAAEIQPEFNFEISVCFIQIYMEMIQDLLEPGNSDIKIKEDLVNGVYVSGALWVPVKNVGQGMKVFSLGEKNRATSFTKLNAHSSRSHAVFMVKIEKSKKLTEKQMQKLKAKTSRRVATSTLFLVDLAGSE
jgi:hypothetical protein